MLGKLAQARQPYPLATEQALDAGRRTGPLLLQGFQVPVQMPLVLGFHRGHMHHPPHLTFAIRIAHQHAQQLAHVQPIALGPTLAAIDCNGGGIHHVVGDPLRLQKAMQPEAFTTRFIATHHRRGFRQTKASFWPGRLLGARAPGDALRPRAHVAFDRARGEAELPGLFTQFKGHKQDTLLLWYHGRCGSLSSSWAFSSMV